MIGREKRVLLRHYLEQGMNKAEAARALGISRRTVYYWIETGQLDRGADDAPVAYGPRRAPPSKLDPYKPMIEARLETFPKLTAVRLFKEIAAAGYPGGYSQVKRYVRDARPRPAEEPVVRFETEPGRQGQVDFATFQLPWGRRHALLVALGYSRVIWGQFYTRQTMVTLMRGLEAAFATPLARSEDPRATERDVVVEQRRLGVEIHELLSTRIEHCTHVAIEDCTHGGGDEPLGGRALLVRSSPSARE
jgi:transposase